VIPTDTITFNSEGGSSVASISGLQGTKITLPAAPTYAGHTFNGWFAAVSGGTALTSPYTLTSSTTLYAQWTVIPTDTITFNSEGGSSVASISGLQGTKITLPAAPTYAGHTFNGWFLAASGGTALTSPYTLTSSTTLYAQWTAIPKLTISATTVNFGTVYLNSISLQEITLTNTGTTPVTINTPFFQLLKGGDSNQFGAVNLCPNSLAAGKSCVIIVGFYAGPYYNAEQTAMLNIMDNAAGNPQTVMVEAMVIDPVASLSKTSLSFGTVTHGTTSTQAVTLKNTGATPLTISSIASTNASVFPETNNCPASLGAGSSCTINVTFKPVTKGASYSATLNITDNAQSRTQSVTLSGTGG
jgi:uncharacterized repeat protein (TIGR02543 family)